MSEVVIALLDGAHDRGIEVTAMVRHEGNEAHIDPPGETEADPMSADIGDNDIYLLHTLRDESHEMNTHIDEMAKSAQGLGYLMASNAQKLTEMKSSARHWYHHSVWAFIHHRRPHS